MQAMAAEAKSGVRGIATGLRKMVIPILHQCEVVLGREIKLVCHEDNMQVVQGVARGYSPSLRHLQRHDRLSLGFSFEVFTERDEDGYRRYLAEMKYECSKQQKGDVFTKPLARADFESAKSMLGMRVPLKQPG